MTTFTGTSAIGLTWNAAGTCRGVLLERVRDRCRVIRWWEASKSAEHSIAETLTDGLRLLAPGSATVVVAGGDGLCSSFTDLEMPALRPDELRSALTFELRRCAPVPDEKLVWAYRLLPARSGPRLRVRVYYLRQTVWERWLSDLSGLTHSLDMAVPPAAALDPVLSEVPVAFGGDGSERFLFVPREHGGRDVQAFPESVAPPAAFGCGPAPLDLPVLQPGELAALPAPRQAAFGGAVILALYGLSHTFHADRKTGFELPYELRSRRHRQSRLLAASLAAYVGVVGLYGVGRLYADRLQQYESVHRERLSVEAQIADASGLLNEEETKLSEQLRKEMADLSHPRPSMAAALAEITRRVGRTGWCTSFRWNEGSIGIQLRESQEIEDLERTLEQSPLLGDVRQESKKVQAGVIDRKVEMSARYDIGDEQSAPPPSTTPPQAAADDLESEDVEEVEETAVPGDQEVDPTPVPARPRPSRPVRRGGPHTVAPLAPVPSGQAVPAAPDAGTPPPPPPQLPPP